MATSSQLNIQVKTSGVSQAKKGLDSLTKSGSKAEKQTTKLKDGFKSFGKNSSAAIASVDGPLGGVASRVSSLTTLLTTGGVTVTAFAASFAAAAFVIADGVKELDKLNIANAKAEALISATGSAAGKTAAQLEEQAKSLALATLASTEGVQEAQSVLLTFKSVSGNAFDRAISLALDLSSVMGGDAKSAALQLGKALQDPVTGLTALTRSGVSFTDQQKEQIKTLTESGQTLEAQSLILSEIESQYKGAAQAVAKGTLAGAIDTLGQSFKEFTAQVAGKTGALDTFEYAISRIAKGLRNVTESIEPDTAAEAAQKALDLLFEIAEAEEKLNNTPDRGKAAQRARVNQLKARREALLEYASTQAEVENEAIRKAEEAQKKAAALQKEQSENATKLANEEKAAKEKAAKIKSLSGVDFDIETQATSAAQSILSANQSTLQSLEEQRALIQDYYDLEIGDLTSHGEALKILDQQIADERLKIAEDASKKQIEDATKNANAYASITGSISNSFSNIADAISDTSDDSNDAYAAAFALAKGFAVAQGTLNLYSAAIAAMNAPSALEPSEKFANYASVFAAGSSLLSTISSISYSGRLQGGDTNPNGTYMVGERGPELVTFGRDGGSVQSSSQSQQQSTNSKTNYTVVNQTSGNVTEMEEQRVTANDVVLILRDTMPGEISNANSSTSKSLSKSTTSTRRLR